MPLEFNDIATFCNALYLSEDGSFAPKKVLKPKDWVLDCRNSPHVNEIFSPSKDI